MSTNNHVVETVSNPQSLDYANPFNIESLINQTMPAMRPAMQNIQAPQTTPNSIDVNLRDVEMSLEEMQRRSQLAEQQLQNTPEVPAGNTINKLPDNVLKDINLEGDKVSQLAQQHAQQQAAKPEFTEDAKVLALNFLKENGLFVMPADVEINSSNVNDIISYNRNLQMSNALEFIKSRAGDDTVAQLFELTFNGGTIDDLNQGRDILADEQYITEIDVENVEDQRAIIEIYLRDGLDESKPSHKKRLDNISVEIDDIIDGYKGKEVAEEAKNYYLQEIENSKIELQKEINAKNLQREQEFKAQKDREEKWRSNFVTSLKAREWSSEKKDAVIEQFDVLEFNNGTKMPLWKYKLQLIQSNPTDTHHLMDFLSNYNHEQKSFKKSEPSVEKKATQMIFDLINNKNTNKQGVGGNPSSEKAFEPANPYNLKINR